MSDSGSENAPPKRVGPPPKREDEVQISAPGKLFLAGEYAVLEPGRSALVAAVDRKLYLSLRPDPEPIVELWHVPSSVALIGELGRDARAPIHWTTPIPRELRFAARATAFALRLAAEEGLELRGFRATFENDFQIDLNANDLYANESAESRAVKPGLGGSAAASVLAVRATCLAQHRKISPQEVVSLAYVAHWIEQNGSGSGADVAASALGGVLEVSRRPSAPAGSSTANPASADAAMSPGLRAAAELSNSPARAFLDARELARNPLGSPAIEAQPIAFPADLHLLAAWTGEPADTRVLVAQVRACSQAQPSEFRVCIDRISSAADALKSALGAAARDFADLAAREKILAAVRDGAAAMAALGEAAACPIVTPALERICALASAAGCAGKPSGAGGGDCAVVFALGESARDRALAMFRAQGIPAAALGIAKWKAS